MISSTTGDLQTQQVRSFWHSVSRLLGEYEFIRRQGTTEKKDNYYFEMNTYVGELGVIIILVLTYQRHLSIDRIIRGQIENLGGFLVSLEKQINDCLALS